MKRLACFLALAFLFPAIVGAFPSWTAVGIGSHDVDWTPGGSGTLAVAGTFGGATVTFFWCAPISGTPQCFEVDPTGGCTFTSPGFCDFFKGPGTLRLTITGGTPSISAVAAGPTQASAGAAGGGGGVSGLLNGPVTYGDASGRLTQAADFFYNEANGFLGIGTANPAVALHVSNAGATGLIVGLGPTLFGPGVNALQINRQNGSALLALRSQLAPAVGIFTSTVAFFGLDDGANEGKLAQIDVRMTSTHATDPGGEMIFYTSSAGSPLEVRMTMNEAGLGIEDGLSFEFPESSTAPPGTESASYWDTATKELCIHDGTSFGCISMGVSLVVAISGEMHQINPGGGGGPHITMTTPGTFVGWVDATAGPLVGGVTFTNDATADFLTLPTTGTYTTTINTSFSGDVNRIYSCQLHINGSIDGALIAIEMGNSSAVNSGAGSTTGVLTAGDQLSVRCTKETGTGTQSISFYSMVLSTVCADC